ncbi:alpha/beta hydrolase [Clostridium grantii]|uniref:Acetyl esterase/lipase n=1 Tax=Clostridium grantii DSM 8605 TaxID=1121316 RepID=A0A1M5TGZ7_9CLOT|nr:alpha/beta hydrolase [Clostridium grantii]SHH49938.1 Acetyl esterase/lipase [Clostridium grantii DSM 8605]
MINKRIDIWGSDNYKGSGEDGFFPTLDTYILDGEKKRPAVLICAGGGYGFTSEREKEPIAMKFNSAGFHAFILNYSVAPRKHPQPLLDTSRAMCIIRENADQWKIDSEKIAVCGFSAGGHLAASLGVHFEKNYLFDTPLIKKELNKPNALILAYPVITSGEFAHRGSFDNLLGLEASEEILEEMSLEKQVNDKVPPTFIWHTFEDTAVPVENTLLFARELRKNNVPFELHIYPEGGHGLSLAIEETANDDTQVIPHVATWIELCTQWLENLMK